MKYLYPILMIGLAFPLKALAQSQELLNRWGKGSFISKPSSTLNGVKPKASWIWDSGEENPRNYYLLVRKTFDLQELPKNATAFISAYAYADVYINGKLLERCPINCDPEFQCYDNFNIRSYLHAGLNCIAAVVQNFGVGLHSQMNARGGFFFQAKLEFTRRTPIELSSNSSWKVAHAKSWNTNSRFRDPNAHLIGIVEEFDARLWPEGWKSPDFNDSNWENAKKIGIPPVAPFNSLVVVKRPHLLRTIVKPVRHWRSKNVMVYDFGTEIVGYPEFSVAAANAGVQFEIGTGERLDKDDAPLLRVSSDHSEKYTTKKGPQTWRPFTWSGFRYFSIETKPGVEIKDVQAEFARYNYELDSSFECSDPELNRFWKIGRRTMQINSVDTYEDPWREHTQYIAGDSRYMLIYGNYAFGKSSRLLSAYNLICGAQSQRWRSDGAIRSRYPTGYYLQPGSSTYIADYQLEWVLMLHEYFTYYGRDRLLEDLYPNMKRAMDYFRKYVDPHTGLLSNIPGWIVLDWPDTYKMERKSTITGINCQYYGALNSAAAIASDFAHDEKQARIWKRQAQQLKASINKYLWSEKDGAYLDSYGGTATGQQPQVYALVYGVPTPSQKTSMTQLIERHKKQSEESFAYWVLDSMFNEGHDQWALDYMRQNWGAQTKLASFNGAWHEGWDLPWGSTSHAWSSGPTALLPQKVLGIEPTGYGWKTFSVRPHPGDLQWAKGTVNTIAGDIKADWRKTTNGRFTLNLTIPRRTTARVYLPTSNPSSIAINATPLAREHVLMPDQDSLHRVSVTLPSGTYHFQCRQG